jgi:hypothetical protein
LNKAYSACCNISTSWGGTHPNANNGGIAVPIQFVLAKRTPDCEATNGINRINGNVLPGYNIHGVNVSDDPSLGPSDSTLKALSIWDNRYYLNIWIVSDIQGNTITAGNIAGYAYYPGAPSYLDGIVLHRSYIKWAIVHEVGHYLGLMHTFHGATDDTSCADNDDCAQQGDRVCDTAPLPVVTNCPSGINPCTGTNYISIKHNYMGYTACPNRFTAGQRARILFHLYNYRHELLYSNGMHIPNIPLDTSPIPYPTQSCAPTGIVHPVDGVMNDGSIGIYHVSLSNIEYYSGGLAGDYGQSYINHLTETYDCQTIRPQKIARVQVNNTYELSISTGIMQVDTMSRNTIAWIDWNGDEIFESSEIILEALNTTEVHHALSLSIPDDAMRCYTLRMRIVSDRADAPIPTPCAHSMYGQVEDFGVLIQKTEHFAYEGESCYGTPYPFMSHNYTVSGTYSHTFTNIFGCDTVHTLTLAVDDSRFDFEWVSVCFGETYVFFGDTITHTGTYIQHIPNEEGCDSVFMKSIAIFTESASPVWLTPEGALTSYSAFGYQWYLNGEPIPGATEQQYFPTEPGNYHVVAFIESDCTVTSQVFHYTGIGINELEQTPAPRIYPNPSTGIVLFDINENDDYTVKLYNSFGQLIQEHFISPADEHRLNWTHHPNGVYVVKLCNGNDCSIQRIVLQH